MSHIVSTEPYRRVWSCLWLFILQISQCIVWCCVQVNTRRSQNPCGDEGPKSIMLLCAQAFSEDICSSFSFAASNGSRKLIKFAWNIKPWLLKCWGWLHSFYIIKVWSSTQWLEKTKLTRESFKNLTDAFFFFPNYHLYELFSLRLSTKSLQHWATTAHPLLYDPRSQSQLCTVFTVKQTFKYVGSMATSSSLNQNVWLCVQPLHKRICLFFVWTDR